jgi:dTDP-L-rhamnose 4-epimerase
VSVVLVTGGAGFIGSHLVDALLEGGESVRVFDNLDPLAHPNGRPSNPSADAELIVGDLRDKAAVERALAGVDRVFHLGGVVGNGESMINARRAVDHNAGGTATLLEAVIERRDRIRRVVAASSMVVYGEGSYRCPEHGVVHPPLRHPDRLRRREWEARCPRCGAAAQPVPTREGAPLRPTSVYGITKRDQEELVLVLGRAYGVETVALRYLNVYGPRQALANPYTGVAAIFAARVLNGRSPLVFEDGGQIRDLVHVSDVVRATRAAMEAPPAAGHAINVATGRRVRVLELARAVAGALGSDLPPNVTGEFRAGDIRHCFADVSRARELLGFEAAVTLDRGLPELAAWVAEQRVVERGDEAVAELRARGLVAESSGSQVSASEGGSAS